MFTPVMQIPFLSRLFRRTHGNSGLLAIGVSSSGVSFIRVRRSGDLPQVEMCVTFPATDVTSAVLEKLRKEAHIGNYQFTTLLDSGEYQLLLVDAPNVPVDELKTAIRWRIKDTLTCHVDDATVDVLQIPSSKSGSERPQSLYAVAASNDTLRKRIALFENARIDLEIIDIPEMAQRNIAELFEERGRGLALLAFDDLGGLLTFTLNGELYLARRFEVTAGQLQDANDDLRQQAIDRIELEVQRSLDYFDRQFNHIPISRMLVLAPMQSGLIKMLANNLDFPVERLDLAQVMDISAAPDLADSDFLAYVLPTLGAALRQERRTL